MSKVQSMEPKSIGQLLDRAMRLTPLLFKRMFFLFFLGASAKVWINEASMSQDLPSIFAAGGVLLLIAFPVLLITILLARELWNGRREATVSGVKAEATLSLVMRFLFLSGWLLTITILLGSLLLFPAAFYMFIPNLDLPLKLAITSILGVLTAIPFIVYAVNRYLSTYILVAKNTSVKSALKLSKELMTQESWFSTSGPSMRLTGLVIVYIIIAFVFGAIGQAAGIFFLLSPEYTEILRIVVGLLNAMATYFVTAFAHLTIVGFFYDLSARYEGSDLLAEIESLE